MKTPHPVTVLKASLLLPAALSIPGFALIYQKMWPSLACFAFVNALLGLAAYTYGSYERDAALILIITLHFLSLSYVAISKTGSMS